jgi:hypothetical protein
MSPPMQFRRQGDIILKTRHASPATFDFIGKAALTALILVLITSSGTGPLIWASERPAAVDAARLKGVHDKLLATYASDTSPLSTPTDAKRSSGVIPILSMSRATESCGTCTSSTKARPTYRLF